VYRVEVVLHLEIQIPSVRIAILEGLSEDENHKPHLVGLEFVDEKRLKHNKN